MPKPFTIFLVVFSFNLSMLCRANEANHLRQMIITRRRSQSASFSSQDYWTELLLSKKREYSPVFIAPQEGLMQADKIEKLPGQPDNVDFDQYSGYVTVDPKAGRALFYYFVESPSNSSTNPLLLWLNGGPGCSSFGAGAMQELGPFRVKSDGKSLYRNDYAWNNVANVIFLESPAGVGFSYSNTSSDYNVTGDTSTANDSYTFLVNWLERFPQYKTRDLYIAGESYAGHYVPQLAQTILINNKNTNQTVINLKGIAIGNALVNDSLSLQGDFDHIWTHALNSDETHRDIIRYCDFESVNLNDQCYNALYRSELETGSIDIDNIYAPNRNSGLGNSSNGSIDPCAGDCVSYYLNTPEVQKALHVNPTTWILCRTYRYWTDWQRDVLPTIKFLMASNMRVWFYSGDVDANIPVTSTRFVINSLKLPIESTWRPWYLDNEVGGYVVGYKGLTFVTVRGAGHWAPSDQPQRSLTMISSFLQGLLPPPSSA